MSALFDRPVLEAAIDLVIDNPRYIPDLIKANGKGLEDVAMTDQFVEILRYLDDLHVGRVVTAPINRELMASQLAEASARHKDRGDWLNLLESLRGNRPVEAFQLFADRLSTLRYKRRVAEIGERAQNGCKPSEILERLEIAKLDLESSAGTEPLPYFDFSKDLPMTREALVGDDNQQLIMPGEKTCVAADSGTGKTKLLTELAFGIASGGVALGFRCQSQPVVLVSSDGDPDLERNIRRQWEGRGGKPSDLAELPLRVWADETFCLEDAACHARLRKTLEVAGADRQPVTTIIESLATNVQETDLNDQGSVRQFISRNLGTLMASFPGLSVLMSHHLRKPQRGGGNELGVRVAGSVQIRAAFDAIIGLTVAGRDAFTVSRIKRSRSGGDFEGFRVQIVGDRQGSLSLRNKGPVTVGVEELRGAARAVMGVMRRSGSERRTLKEIVTSVAGFQKRAVEKACKRLSEAEEPQLIRVSKKPAAYELAPDKGDFLPEGVD